MRVGVLEGDVAGSLDADRLSRLHVPVTQLNTDQGFGGECHLDANMVRSALPEVPLDEIDLLVIENVGNLVCPAEFRVGEDARAMVCSITEGEDKPLKYPLMFRACELVIVNKIDLLPHLDVDLDLLLGEHRRGQPGRAAAAHQRAHRRGRQRAARLAGGGGGPGDGSRRELRGPHRGPRAPAGGPAGEPHAGERALLRGRGGAHRAPVPRDGGAVRARRPADRRRGGSPGARSDARHVAVEFVHPVIVGKRALPAIALTDPGPPARWPGSPRPEDMVIAVGTDRRDPDAEAALAVATERGLPHDRALATPARAGS